MRGRFRRGGARNVYDTVNVLMRNSRAAPFAAVFDGYLVPKSHIFVLVGVDQRTMS